MSLRLRLTITFTMLLALTLVAFGAVLYLMMQQNLEDEMNRRLRIRAQQVKSTMWPQANSLTPFNLKAAQLDLSPLAQLSSQSLYVQVLDPNGEILSTSDNLRDVTLPVDQDDLQEAFTIGEKVTNVRLGRAGGIRTFISPIRGANDQAVGFLQVGQSLSGIAETLDALRFRLLLAGGLALFTAGASGWIVAHRGLRPLALMAKQARDLADERDFSGRLEVKKHPDEVGKLAATIDDLLETVEETLNLHRQFLADTSHELRNPLLAVRTNLELLGRVTRAEEREECAREATEQIERLSALVAELLLLARVEAGLIIDRQPVRVASILDRVISEAHKSANAPSISLRVNDDAWTSGDPERLLQIFSNLVDNAIRNTPTRGEIAISLRVENESVQVDVRDSGVGISAEHLPRIFDRFYRGDRKSGEGTGLGLAIVKHLAELHGGSVSVDSQVGEGSCFSVHLPLLLLEEAAEQPPSLVPA